MNDKAKPAKPSRLEQLKARRAQINAEIDRQVAAESSRRRKEETARKIEIGALLLHHARENPDSEVALVIRRLLNRYVPNHRRNLFIEEFGIDPLKPENSVANDSGKNRTPDSPDLKSHFPGNP